MLFYYPQINPGGIGVDLIYKKKTHPIPPIPPHTPHTPELGGLKGFPFYHFGLGGRGPSGSNWARNPGLVTRRFASNVPELPGGPGGSPGGTGGEVPKIIFPTIARPLARSDRQRPTISGCREELH